MPDPDDMKELHPVKMFLILRIAQQKKLCYITDRLLRKGGLGLYTLFDLV